MNLQLKWIWRGILLRLHMAFVKYTPNIHCLLGFLSQKIFSNYVYTFLHYGLNKDQPLLICRGLKQSDIMIWWLVMLKLLSHASTAWGCIPPEMKFAVKLWEHPSYGHLSCFRLHNLYLTACFCIDLLCLPKCLNFQVTEYDPLPVFAG